MTIDAMQTSDVPSPARRRLALAWIWLIAGWVATGALFKLFLGTPALLPEVVREVGLELGTTYNLVIGIELAIVMIALTRPRWGWALQVLLLLVFDFVLTTQIRAGAENCGCFGADLHVNPKVMLAIDSALLVGLLTARPWSCLGPGLNPVVPIVLAAAALTAPWLLDRQVKTGEVVTDGKPVDGQWVELALEKWVGQDVWDTPLGQPPLNAFIDVNALPLDGLWVFWRQTCDHCAKHLAHLAETEHGERLIALVQLEEPNDTLANRVVTSMPDGNFVSHAVLPPTMSYLLQTPGELLLEGGKIVAAREGATDEDGL